MIVWYFFKWMLLKVFNVASNMHVSFQRGLQRDTLESVFFWCIFVILTTLAEALIVGGIAIAMEVRPSPWWVLDFVFGHIIYFVCTVISVMFKCFKRERAELFEKIKHGR